MKKFKKNLLVFAVSLTTMISLLSATNYTTTQVYAEGETIVEEQVDEPSNDENQQPSEEVVDDSSNEETTDETLNPSEGEADISLASDESGVEVQSNENSTEGVTYSYTYDSKTKQAMISGITSNITVSDLVLPSTTEYDGEEYTITKIQVLSNSGNYDWSSVKSITIPDTVTSLSGKMNLFSSLESVQLSSNMTSIPNMMFQNCKNLKSVTSSGTLTSIGTFSFAGCTSLTQIPDLSNVTKMNAQAFNGCTSLNAEVNLSSLNSIPYMAFYNTPITVTKLSDNLTSVATWAFTKATIKETSDETFTFPSTLTSIGSMSFTGVTFPKTVEIPDSVTTIDKNAFQEAKGVETIKIGSGVTTITSNAFSDIKSLKKIIIDNSEANISGKENLPNVKIIYLKDMTLQDKVDEAENGDTIILDKDYKLTDTLVIPEGKEITIASADGQTYTISGDNTNSLKDLIQVESGAKVTFSNVTLSGSNNTESIISSAGDVTLSSGATVENGIGVSNKGVINITGEGSLTLDGAIIQNNTVNDQVSGTIRVSDNGTISIVNGQIQNNKVSGWNSFNSSSGILITGNGSGTMTGGSISGNSANRGSAIMLYNVKSGTGTATFEQSGGEISGNTCESRALEGSGAVHVEGYASYTLTDGSITGNTGVKGGGVTAVDPGVQNGSGDYGTVFVMNGGTISNNDASTAVGCGGGIYSYSNGVTLNAGTISGNTASYLGGGIYSEGNSDHYTTMHMNNALIKGNNATKHGGGLWFCPTGDGSLANDSAIYDNTAGEAGADVAAARNSRSAFTLPNRMLGGGKIDWYKDGGVYTNMWDSVTQTNKDVPRYPDIKEQVSTDQLRTGGIAVKAIVEEDAKTLAESSASLFITGNSAAYGGGIGANGGAVIGEDTETMDIPVQKVWENVEGVTLPESIQVQLKLNGYTLETLNLSAENNWQGTFTGLPIQEGYTISEVSVTGYTSEVTGDQSTGFTIINTYQTVDVSGTKTWSDNDNQDGKRPESITVNLLANGTQVQSQTVTAETNWTYVFTGLAKYDSNGSEITYSVTEDAVDNYTTSYSEEGYDITNTHTPDKTSLTVTKVWSDSDNKDGIRPESVTVKLLADGKETDKTVTLSADNKWTAVFEELDMYSNGKKIEYTIEEVKVDGYTSKITGDASSGYTITNTHTPTEEEKPKDKEKPKSDTKTGVSIHLIQFSLLADVSLAGAVLMLLKKRK